MTRTAAHRRHHRVRTLGIVLLALVALRVALPHGIEFGINRALKSNKQVTGHVGDVDISIWRGAYRVDDIELRDAQRADRPPFAAIGTTDLSIDMRELFHGRLLAKAHLTEPVINVSAVPKKKDSEEVEEGADEVRKSFVPFELSRLEITSGTVVLPSKALGGDEVKMDRVFIVAENLIGPEGAKNQKYATLKGTSRLPGNGALDLDLTFDPKAEDVTFDVNLKLEGMDLAALNPVIKPAAGIDLQSGSGNLYAEARASGGKFEGYVKPILQDVEIRGEGEGKEGLGEKIKERVAEIVKDTLKNEKKDSVGARVPFSGSFDNPSIGIWSAVGTTLRHAFIRAIRPGVENKV